MKRRFGWLTRFVWPGAVVVLVVAGSGVYLWQHHQVSHLHDQVGKLNSQVQTLQSQASAMQQQTAAAQLAAQKTAKAKTSNPAAPSSCSGNEMKLSLGSPTGTADTAYIDAILTNQASQACTLQGYPVVVLSDSNNQPLSQQATQSGISSAPTVTIQPGKTAHVAVGFPDPGALSPGTCSQASYLSLTLPGDSTTLQTATTQQYCPGFSVSAIEAGG